MTPRVYPKRLCCRELSFFRDLMFSKSIYAAVALFASQCATHAGAETASAATKQWCTRVSTKLADVAAVSCNKFGLEAGTGKSRNGIPILSKIVKPDGGVDSNGKPLPKVMLIGGIHGDELTSSSIVFKWLELVHSGPGANFIWNIVPVANPDGLLASKPSRLNEAGVDLNRNFKTENWKVEAPHYWAKRTNNDPRRYPGPAPLSEPETKWLDAEIKRFKPDVIVSVHAPYGLLDFDGPRDKAPARFGELNLSPLGVYPGSLGNYGGTQLGVPVITIELAHALVMPPKPEVERIWRDMLDWIGKNTPRERVANADMPGAPSTKAN